MRRSKRTLKLGWRELWPVWAVFGVLIAFGIVGLRLVFPTPTPPKVLRAGEDLTLNLSDLDPAKVRLFAYPVTPQTQVEFFVKRGTSSGITVALASCRRCYHSGHYERDGQILCGHCNEPMERLGAGQTPATEKDCKPIPIPFEMSGNQLVVRGNAARATFARWYAPGLAEDASAPSKGKRGE
jgi:uncharacterized membrane protein